jgi:hypothetical protein
MGEHLSAEYALVNMVVFLASYSIYEKKQSIDAVFGNGPIGQLWRTVIISLLFEWICTVLGVQLC